MIAAAILSRRLHTAVCAAYLRYRLREARKDANVIEAEMLVAPQRLANMRHYISATADKLRALEARHD